MPILNEIKDLLNQILISNTAKKTEYIKIVQKIIWNDESMHNQELNEMLSELAYDLDFYEPNKEWREEGPNYYGDERLEEIIKLALQKLNSF